MTLLTYLLSRTIGTANSRVWCKVRHIQSDQYSFEMAVCRFHAGATHVMVSRREGALFGAHRRSSYKRRWVWDAVLARSRLCCVLGGHGNHPTTKVHTLPKVWQGCNGPDFQLMRIPLFCVCESFASHKQKV